MNKILIVFMHEIRTTVLRKSFIVTLFLIPIIGFLVTIIIGNSQSSTSTSVIQNIFTPKNEVKIFGLVDQSGIIQEIPDNYQDLFVIYPNQPEGEMSLKSGKIAGFYVIDPDYVNNGKVVLIKTDFDPLGDDLSWQLENMITEQILRNDPQIVNRIQNINNFEIVIRSPETSRDPESSLTFFLPYIVTMIFYVIILGSSSLMLNSVTNEKTNRVLEILMTSISPLQMLTGKIIALGLVGLLQTIIWSGAGLILLRISGRTMNIPLSFQLPTSILFWGILFFIGGYAFYASLMAGVGALVPNLKEASQATTVLIIPLIIPLMLISLIIDKPNGPISLFFSLFPPTSPVTMMTRLSAGNVPIWQILLSLALIFLCSFLVLRSISNLFRAQTMLSGQEFKLKYFFKALLGMENH
ncbi:MAG: hypothetical protein CVU46_12325 [Chloroflexi bacterium HGW-Chloroflexi-8]|nr:MAG: hypothetical protein CVU46_12325 [Chloroflexi bacterium HGW-Chloroflexi-8]